LAIHPTSTPATLGACECLLTRATLTVPQLISVTVGAAEPEGPVGDGGLHTASAPPVPPPPPSAEGGGTAGEAVPPADPAAVRVSPVAVRAGLQAREVAAALLARAYALLEAAQTEGGHGAASGVQLAMKSVVWCVRGVSMCVCGVGCCAFVRVAVAPPVRGLWGCVGVLFCLGLWLRELHHRARSQRRAL
jgi:hypothetical protein